MFQYKCEVDVRDIQIPVDYVLGVKIVKHSQLVMIQTDKKFQVTIIANPFQLKSLLLKFSVFKKSDKHDIDTIQNISIKGNINQKLQKSKVKKSNKIVSNVVDIKQALFMDLYSTVKFQQSDFDINATYTVISRFDNLKQINKQFTLHNQEDSFKQKVNYNNTYQQKIKQIEEEFKDNIFASEKQLSSYQSDCNYMLIKALFSGMNDDILVRGCIDTLEMYNQMFSQMNWQVIYKTTDQQPEQIKDIINCLFFEHNPFQNNYFSKDMVILLCLDNIQFKSKILYTTEENNKQYLLGSSRFLYFPIFIQKDNIQFNYLQISILLDYIQINNKLNLYVNENKVKLILFQTELKEQLFINSTILNSLMKTNENYHLHRNQHDNNYTKETFLISQLLNNIKQILNVTDNLEYEITFLPLNSNTVDTSVNIDESQNKKNHIFKKDQIINSLYQPVDNQYFMALQYYYKINKNEKILRLMSNIINFSLKMNNNTNNMKTIRVVSQFFNKKNTKVIKQEIFYVHNAIQFQNQQRVKIQQFQDMGKYEKYNNNMKQPKDELKEIYQQNYVNVQKLQIIALQENYVIHYQSKDEQQNTCSFVLNDNIQEENQFNYLVWYKKAVQSINQSEMLEQVVCRLKFEDDQQIASVDGEQKQVGKVLLLCSLVSNKVFHNIVQTDSIVNQFTENEQSSLLKNDRLTQNNLQTQYDDDSDY